LRLFSYRFSISSVISSLRTGEPENGVQATWVILYAQKRLEKMQMLPLKKKRTLWLAIVGLFLFTTSQSAAQISEADSIALSKVITDFKASIIEKDSVRFDSLFFSTAVDFTGIMSEKTEWSIKKGYPEFQGIAVSSHKDFIKDICKTPKKQEERFYNVVLSADGAIGSISFDYAFYSDDKMIQWGNEKWNMAKDGKKWLITDVVYSIHFPHVEPFPFE